MGVRPKQETEIKPSIPAIDAATCFLYARRDRVEQRRISTYACLVADWDREQIADGLQVTENYICSIMEAKKGSLIDANALRFLFTFAQHLDKYSQTEGPTAADVRRFPDRGSAHFWREVDCRR